MNSYWSQRFLTIKKISEKYTEEYIEEILLEYEELYAKVLKDIRSGVRRESILTQLGYDWLALAAIHVERFSESFFEVANEVYLRNIYTINDMKGTLNNSFGRYDTRAIDLLLDKEWYGANWKDRVWFDEGIIAPDEMAKILRQSIVEGWPGEKAVDELLGLKDSLEKRIKQLVRSELAFISEQATLKAYEDMGVEKYRYTATLEKNTCEICGDLDSQVFYISEAVVGENYPTIHANCRCTTVPVVSLAPSPVRWMMDPETGNKRLIPDMSFNEWKQKYLSAA